MRLPKRSITNVILAFALILFINVSATAADLPDNFLVTAAGVRVRSQPSTKGKKLDSLDLGDVVPLLGRTDVKKKVGKGNDYWYNVKLPNGKSGWLFGALGTPFFKSDATAQYRQLSLDRIKRYDLKSADHLSLYLFLSGIAGKQSTPALQHEFELYRLLALQLYLDAEGFKLKEKDLPTHKYLKEWKTRLVYSEPAGQWLVKADVLWDLHKKAKGTPVADLIAWKAANQQLPGETEGYPPAILDYMDLTMGKYLAAHPDGQHATDAIVSYMGTFEPYAKDVETLKSETYNDKKEIARFAETMKKTKAILSKSAQPTRIKVIEMIDNILSKL